MARRAPRRPGGMRSHLRLLATAALFGLGAYAVVLLMIEAARLAGLHGQ